jgi:hypothetical protein
MASLDQDIVLDDAAFSTASSDMKQLKTRTENLKNKLHKMYNDMITALNTPAGEQMQVVGEKVIVKPIEDMIIVIDHISSTLDQVIDTGYYKDVFIKYEQLNQNIKS